VKADAHPLLLGQLLQERYQVVQVLSAGAFGQTYIAQDTERLDSPKCVIKCLKAHNQHSNLLHISRRLFMAEAETLQKVHAHDQIPQLLACFEENQAFYLVQEWIDGQSLMTVLPDRKHGDTRWSESQCIALLRDVLGILEFIHRQGVIHGDLKPNNLIRRHCDDKCVLIDYGAAHPVRPYLRPHAVKLAQSEVLTIKPFGYLPLEQLLGQPQPNSDIYALGIIGIQALTGIDPANLQTNPDTNEVLWRNEVLVSNQLSSVLERMVCYDCNSRYPSAREVLQALEPLSFAEAPVLVAFPGFLPVEPVLPNAIAEVLADYSFLIPSENSPAVNADATPLDVQIMSAETESETVELQMSFKELAAAFVPDLPPLLKGVSAGMAATNAITIAVGLSSLIHVGASNTGSDLLWQATEQYQAGNFKGAIALAQSVPKESTVYEETQAAIQTWRWEWHSATARFQSAQQAFKESRWLDVAEAARQIPDVPYWQAKLAPLLEKTAPKLEAEAHNLLQKAYDRAAIKDFAGARNYLLQIPQQTSIGSQVQQKLAEYTQKQSIRADAILQKAYDRAAKQDFTQAVVYLRQISEDTPAHKTAKVKIVEYTAKHRIKEEAEAIAASQKSKQSQISSASSNLNPGTRLREVVGVGN
jgi:serine/threonine protein kinase